MNRSVTSVKPLPGYRLSLLFSDDESRVFDVSPYLEKGIFKELQDIDYFNQVLVAFGSIQWPNEQDFSKDTLYLLSIPTEKAPEPGNTPVEAIGKP